jgi:two-component system, NtrC family, nitrogen regulation sensor histidine kinase NtrY
VSTTLAETAPSPSRLRRLADFLLGRFVTLILAATAGALGIGSFAMMSSGAPLSLRPNLATALVVSNLAVLLLLGASLAGRLTRVWVARRQGSAGAKLHVRLVMLFSVVAVAPTIMVGIFTTAFFGLGIQTWFNDRVRTALEEGLQASQGYLSEHRDTIKTDALGMKADLERAGRILAENPYEFDQVLVAQTTLRGLDEAIIYRPDTGEVVASAGLMAGLGPGQLPAAAVEAAQQGEVPILGNEASTEVRALVELNSTPSLMLLIERAVDPRILDHMRHTEEAVAEYQRVDQNRSGLQVTFALIFALVALLVLSAAVLIGLVLANQIVRPVSRLIEAAERVRGGDLAVRVPEVESGDELAGLSRAFNRMTDQLGSQRTELMEAYGQIDERRRFTESVLAGVSAGVIGLDGEGRIELPNRAAADLLGADIFAYIGRPLTKIVPELGPMLEGVMAEPERPVTGEVQVGQSRARRTFLVRIGAEQTAGRTDGYVVTFDDITELQSAQRKAAWADVARRIAHEIKNPLTPIQLAAERLKRRFAREITSDPQTFTQCADTIIRHVGDIGRMVDEFSAFARMPLPVIKREDIGRIAREALVLQRSAHPEIVWQTDIPERGPVAPADRRLLGQALTNLLQNAADSVAMKEGLGSALDPPRDSGPGMTGPAAPDPHLIEDGGGTPSGGQGAEPFGLISLAVQAVDGEIRIAVSDNGIGLPQHDRDRLTEPYVTHKAKGTGLGLAIVKKIMEDHGGSVTLDDRPGHSPGAVATLPLPATSVKAADGA